MEKHNPTSTCEFPDNEIEGSSEIYINNFVYEPEPFEDDSFIYRNYFVMNILIAGEAEFATDYKTYLLKKGDLFFSFPLKRYRKYNLKNAKFIYISFSGNEIKQLLKNVDITYTNPVKTGLVSQSIFATKEFFRSEESNGNSMIPKSLFYYFLSFFNKVEPKEKKKSNNISGTINDVLKYIKDHYNEDLSLTLLSRKFYISYNYLSILIRNMTGVNFAKYIETIRIEQAKRMMNDSNKTITFISSEVGYNDVRYFDRVFKKYVGISPSKYRETLQK